MQVIAGPQDDRYRDDSVLRQRQEIRLTSLTLLEEHDLRNGRVIEIQGEELAPMPAPQAVAGGIFEDTAAGYTVTVEEDGPCTFTFCEPGSGADSVR